MIEIKNKRMILFPEDRIIGAEGDIKTANRQFVMDSVQAGYDLSDMIAMIKLQPIGTGEAAYSQLLSKEVRDGRIFLTWLLSGANLKSAGELSAQIMFISRGYFNEEDLSNLADDELIVPSIIEGVSAPVWQSFKETFIIAQSIDDTVAYNEITKSVLNAAVADAAYSAQAADLSSKSANLILKNMKEKISYADELYSAMQNQADEARTRASEADKYSKRAEEYYNSADASAQQAAAYSQQALSYKEAAEEFSLESEAAAERANSYSHSVAYMEQACAERSAECSDLVNEAKGEVEKIKNIKNHRLLYSQTLTNADEGCISFEINVDMNNESFRLSEFAFYVYVPKMETVGGTYLRIDAIGEGNGVYSPMVQFSGISRTDNQYLRINGKNMGRWVCEVSKHTSLSANIESNTNYKSVCTQQRRTDGKCVTALRLEQHSSVGTAFPEGTVVEVWGLDVP